MSGQIHYTVGRDWAKALGGETSIPHRVLSIDSAGDIVVRRQAFGESGPPIHQMSRAELDFIAREVRRARRRRFWRGLLGARR